MIPLIAGTLKKKIPRLVKLNLSSHWPFSSELTLNNWTNSKSEVDFMVFCLFQLLKFDSIIQTLFVEGITTYIYSTTPKALGPVVQS